MGEVKLRSIFSPYLRDVSQKSVDDQVRAKAEQISRMLARHEPNIMYIQSLLIWERPERSATLFLCMSASFWLVSVSNINGILAAASALTCVSYVDVIQSRLSRAQSQGPGTVTRIERGLSFDEDRQLKMTHLSQHAALLCVYAGLYFHATCNMRRLHPGGFCVLISSANLVLAGIGLLIPGVIITYVVFTGILVGPCAVQNKLLQRLCVAITPATSYFGRTVQTNKLESIAGQSSEAVPVLTTSYNDSADCTRDTAAHSNSADGSLAVSGNDNVMIKAQCTESDQTALKILPRNVAELDGSAFIPDIQEMPAHDTVDVCNQQASDSDELKKDDLCPVINFLADHFEETVEFNDEENSFLVTASERERFDHTEVDPASVYMITSALESALTSVMSDCDPLGRSATDRASNGKVVRLSSASEAVAAGAPPSLQLPAVAARSDSRDSDSDFEVLSVEDFANVDVMEERTDDDEV